MEACLDGEVTDITKDPRKLRDHEDVGDYAAPRNREVLTRSTEVMLIRLRSRRGQPKP